MISITIPLKKYTLKKHTRPNVAALFRACGFKRVVSKNKLVEYVPRAARKKAMKARRTK